MNNIDKTQQLNKLLGSSCYSIPNIGNIFMRIAMSGHCYNPAWMHYNNNRISVTCDRCYKKNVSLCYGCPGEYYDLCNDCYQAVCQYMFNHSKKTDSINDTKSLSKNDPFRAFENNSLNNHNIEPKNIRVKMRQLMYHTSN